MVNSLPQPRQHFSVLFYAEYKPFRLHPGTMTWGKDTPSDTPFFQITNSRKTPPKHTEQIHYDFRRQRQKKCLQIFSKKRKIIQFSLVMHEILSEFEPKDCVSLCLATANWKYYTNIKRTSMKGKNLILLFQMKITF